MGKESVLKRGDVEALALALLTAKPKGAELYFREKVGLPGVRPAQRQRLSREGLIRVLDHDTDMLYSRYFSAAGMQNGLANSLLVDDLSPHIG